MSIPVAGFDATFTAVEGSCAKVLQNKVRNLRKVIEKASQLEEAKMRGDELNEQQLESVRSKEFKVMLLKELEEVNKKQATIFKDERTKAKFLITEEPPTSSVSEVAKEEKEEKVEESITDTTDVKDIETSLEPPATTPAEQIEPTNEEPEVEESPSEKAPPVPDVAPVIRTVVINPKDRGKYCINNEKESVSALLEFFGKRKSAGQETLIATEQDLRAISYFAMMLTTPDGLVPIEDAVDVSIYHGEKFLNSSGDEAFSGCSYEILSKMVSEVANSDYLKFRGAENAEAAEKDASDAAAQHETPLNFFAHPETNDARSAAAPGENEESRGQPMNMGGLMNNQMHQNHVDGMDVLQASHHMMQPPHLQAVGMQYVPSHPTAGPIYGSAMGPGMTSGYLIPGPLHNYFPPGAVNVLPQGGQRRGAGRGSSGRGAGSSGRGGNGGNVRRGNSSGNESGARGRGASRGSGRGGREREGSYMPMKNEGDSSAISADGAPADIPFGVGDSDVGVDQVRSEEYQN